MGQLIDTHAHLNFEAFGSDRRAVIERSGAIQVSMINVGVNYASSLRAAEIAGEYDSGVWAAIGLHPENIGDDLNTGEKDNFRPEDIKEPVFDAARYRNLAKSSGKVVAIGEIGLDYLRLPKDEIKAAKIRARQEDIFKRQLALAAELGLPAIIHTRMAHNDTIGILREFAGKGIVNGVVHCFTGTVEEMRQYCELGLYFGLNGIIFKLDLDEAIIGMPLDRILLETDCPFLAPPLAGIKRNEPRFVLNVAERVAAIRNEPVESVIEAATANAKKIFRI